MLAHAKIVKTLKLYIKFYNKNYTNK